MKENADKARALDGAELAKQLKDTSEQMFRLRFQLSMGQADGIKKLRSLRKERARMLTVLRERQDGATVVVKTAKTKTAAAKEAAPKKAAAVAKPKVTATVAPKTRTPSQVKVKPTSAPKAAAKVNMPRKSGKG